MEKLKRISTLAKRFWRIYVRPPKETAVFRDVSELPVITERISLVETAPEPKQVAVDYPSRLAFVSCMKGRVVQAFDYSDGRLEFVRDWQFDEQCVESEVVGDQLFVTSTNFARGALESSHLHFIEIESGEILSSIATGGEWSKVVKIHPNGRWAFVSNWHSHDVSVIDVSDVQAPKVLRVIPCGESPRGIDFLPDGTCLVAGFYSSRVYTIKEIEGKWQLTAKSKKFDPQGYGGNMRDILVAPDAQYAFISNLGRNMVHRFDVQKGEIANSLLVGRNPNSIRFLDRAGKTLLVSCRKDNVVCFVDTGNLKVVGKSAPTGRKPTGLAVADNGFLVTNFADNTLEYHKFRLPLHRSPPPKG